MALASLAEHNAQEMASTNNSLRPPTNPMKNNDAIRKIVEEERQFFILALREADEQVDLMEDEILSSITDS